MKQFFINTQRLFLLTVFLIVSCSIVLAQSMIFVTGTMKNKETHKPFDVVNNPEVWVFNTQAAAQDAMTILLSGNTTTYIQTDGMCEVDESGYYEVADGVSETGALIFKIDGGTPELVKVNGRKKIDIEILGAKNLANVEVVQTIPEIPVPIPAIAYDDWLRMSNQIPVPPEMGRTDLRMIYQPFLVDCRTNDTIEWCSAMVTDGPEYRATQYRRMGFDLRNDALFDQFTGKTLREGLMLDWNDSVQMPDPTDGKYRVLAFIAFEDYNSLVYNNEAVIINGIRRPFRYIDYNCALRDVDPAKYPRKPRRESRDQVQNLNLTFLKASAQLDPENPHNEEELNLLQTSLINVLRTKGAAIHEVRFIGVSSPEGSYATNVSLSRQRIAFVKQQALSKLPQGTASRLFAPEEALVASWDEVIPLLQATYPEVAQRVQAICDATRDHDARSAQISRLPEYDPVITGTFPQLRRVTCECKFEIFRAPNDSEILSEYRNNPAYRNGQEEISLYEYGRLFELLRDSVPAQELEGLYKRALKASVDAKKPWIVPANLLACSYMKRDTLDLDILRPFIKFNGILNMANGQNIEEAVANQMIMYLRSYKTDSAMVLCDKLPAAGYELQKALCNIRNFADPHVFNAIALSSDLNYVIMNLAQGNVDLAEEKWEKLDQNEALTWYLRAVLNCKKGFDGEEDAAEDLVKCWNMNSTFHELADNDGDLTLSAVGFAERLWKERQQTDNPEK